jgi:hypothetical protein
MARLDTTRAALRRLSDGDIDVERNRFAVLRRVGAADEADCRFDSLLDFEQARRTAQARALLKDSVR